MDEDRSRWNAGQEAWQRLVEQQGKGDPLAALGDIGQLRRLIDEAELGAVRGARRGGKSWAEIAVRLGIARQSAWERWRDVDTEPAAGEPPQLIEHTARAARRRASIVVPDVVGLPFDDARNALTMAGLAGVPADPGNHSPGELAARGAVVGDQSPESGAMAQPGAPVKLWTRRGGAGVREPRRPRPKLLVEKEKLEELG